MKPGDWILVRQTPKAKRATLALLVEYQGLNVAVDLYRPVPGERFERAVVPLAQVVEKAPESEQLKAARSLAELPELHSRRKRAGLRIGELAAVAGVTGKTASSAERGLRHTQPSVRMWLLAAMDRIERKAQRS